MTVTSWDVARERYKMHPPSTPLSQDSSGRTTHTTGSHYASTKIDPYQEASAEANGLLSDI